MESRANTCEYQKVDEVYQAEAQQDDVLEEVTELVEMGVPIIDSLLTVAERRQVEVKSLGIAVRKNGAFKARLEAEARALRLLVKNPPKEKRKKS